MKKYYVESGRCFQVVLLATDELDAILRAIARVAADDAPLLMANLIIVSQRGFPCQRPGRQLYGDEFILPTRVVLGPPDETLASGPDAGRIRPMPE